MITDYAFDLQEALGILKDNPATLKRGPISVTFVCEDDILSDDGREDVRSLVDSGVTTLMPCIIEINGFKFDAILVFETRGSLDNLSDGGEGGRLYGSMVIPEYVAPMFDMYQETIINQALELLIETFTIVSIMPDGRLVEFVND